MQFQIRHDLKTVHNDQLVYLNGKDIVLTLLTRFKIKLVHNCQMEDDHLNIKKCTDLLLNNACKLLNTMEICVTTNEKLNIHPKMATLKKLESM